MMHYFYFIAFLQWIIFIVIVTAWKGQCTWMYTCTMEQ
jgi:hypothetical protein